MKTFGKTNTLQASCQSGEDNLEVEVQTEEVLVGARDRQTAVDPPALAQDLLGALSRAMILDEVEPIVNFKSFQLLPCPPVGGMGCCCGGPPYGG